jgi:hydrogenase expression/formation protein HypE
MITLNHGSGGRETQRLIEEIFLPHFTNELGDATRDAAVLSVGGRLAFTTDSFVVDPVFFRGGDIGRLAVCGTVNDLLTSGATPKYLSTAFVLETGLALDDLSKIVRSMALAAAEAGVLIVTGDTKVVEGNGRVFINTAGIGEIAGNAVDFADAKAGDKLIVTNCLGSHHACILSARMGIENEIASDAAPLTAIVSRLTAENIPLHGMRDVTRGGLATVLCELAGQYGFGILVHEENLPVAKSVRGLCDILGLDPLHMGNEGVMLLAAPNTFADEALRLIRSEKYGENASVIGEVTESGVVLRTKVGGNRILAPLIGEGLPRIC